jgi:hypothetical protein
MWENTYPFAEWNSQTWLGQAVGASTWLFPAIEAVHILAMAIMFAGLMVLNLRMLGWGMKTQPLSTLARTLMPYINWGLAVMLLSGYAMFASQATKYWMNDGFRFKMAALALVVLFQLTLYRWVVQQDEGHRPVLIGILASVASFGLWFCVGAAGRAIAFV